jgi:hypothetical protein
MAKVTGPLFSVDARGKIADTLVFMGWRGLKTVRRWTKPANPNTAAQQTTRGYFTDAVSLYHSLSAADKTALRVQASGQPYSGFNVWVGWVKSALDNAKAWSCIKTVTLTPGAGGSGSITVAGAALTGTDLKIRYGRTTSLVDGEVLEVDVSASAFSQAVGSLIADTLYYFKIEVQTPNGVHGETGIYSATSPAAA